MVKKAEQIVLKLVAVVATRRYLKYRLPDELFEDEEPVLLLSGRHVYVHKNREGGEVQQIVLVLPKKEGE
jgi:hypothetical protein